MAQPATPLTLDEMLRQARTRIRRLEPRSAHTAATHGAVLIDIRCPHDREHHGVIPGSLHIPRTVLEWRLAPDSPWRSPYAPDLGHELLLVCDHGYSSSLAALSLTDLGFLNTGDVVGGFEAWRDAGLPTIEAPRHPRVPGEHAGMRPPDGG